MKIKSSDIPQADKIESVLKTIIAVGNNKRTDIEIANSIEGIRGDSRQGRYYRRAAELLGFITNSRNNAALTRRGELFMSSPTMTNPIVLQSVLELKLYQNLIPFMELYPEGLSREEIMNFLSTIADPNMGESMIQRRISTILAWPKTLGIISSNENGYILNNKINLPATTFEILDVEQPILLNKNNLTEFDEIISRSNGARELITFHRNQAKMDRAIKSHSRLVNITAKKIRNAGRIPKSNILIDLAVNIDYDYLFEMKSTSNLNVRSQVRKGISQLYEYRYLQNLPNAKLILVLERPLEDQNNWLLDYTENDREIHLIWDGNDELYGTNKSKSELSFLSLK